METAALQSIPLFAGVSPEELAAVQALCERREYSLGQSMYRAGELSERLYVVASGSVVVTHQLDGGIVTLARLGEGYFFGEAGLLKASQTHQSEARAETDNTEILSLSRKNFLALEQEHPKAALGIVQKIASVLSERLTEDTTRIAIISAISDLITDPKHLNNIKLLASEILAITIRAIPSHTAFLGLYKREDRELVDIVAGINVTPKHLPMTLPIDSDAYLHKLHTEDGELAVPSGRYEKQKKVFYAKKNLLGRSISIEGENIGLLVLADKARGEFSNQNRLMLAIIAGQIAFALEEARTRQEKRAQEELKREYVGM
ncbi:MAG: cyclic nucleotide-binding domain-containing protein [Parcubacteria group bacterium]|nr:cyclic nucleotide-binding domain-containing protein [Parcubacteria group bacterium]